MKKIFRIASVLCLFALSALQAVSAQNSNQNFENSALLIIDIQNDYFPGGKMTLVNADAAAEKARVLLESYRAQNKPIIHIKHIATDPAAGFFLPNTTGAEISTYVTPANGEKVITKHYPNSFRETDLLQYLKNTGVTNLVITGMMTDVCVVSTTRAAMDFGFKNVVISDASTTRDRVLNGKTIPAATVHKSYLAGMNALDGLYAHIKTTQQFLDGQ